MKQNGGRPTACSQNSWDLFAYQSWVEQAFLSPEEEHHGKRFVSWHGRWSGLFKRS